METHPIEASPSDSPLLAGGEGGVALSKCAPISDVTIKSTTRHLPVWTIQAISPPRNGSHNDTSVPSPRTLSISTRPP